jgi:flagellar motor switch protein FliM
MLLGGSGKANTQMKREITEIEQSIMEGFIRIILHDLKEAWRAVTSIDFSVEDFETEPQLLQILSPNEAVVAISIEVRIAESSGMMNLGMPSIIIKMLRQKFDQQWSVRKTESTESEQERMMKLIGPVEVHLDARLRGASLSVADLMELQAGDVLSLDLPVERPIDLLLNGRLKYQGQVVSNGRNRSLLVDQVHVT